MSEATVATVEEQDDFGEADFIAALEALFGGDPQADEALWTRMELHADEVNEFIDSVGFEGTGNSEGYDVHLSELQVRWVLAAIGQYIANVVPHNPHGAGDHLVDSAEAILAAVRS